MVTFTTVRTSLVITLLIFISTMGAVYFNAPEHGTPPEFMGTASYSLIFTGACLLKSLVAAWCVRTLSRNQISFYTALSISLFAFFIHEILGDFIFQPLMSLF